MLCAQFLSRVQLFVTPWTTARQAPLSMGFSRQEYWRGLPCPPPGDLPHPGIKPRSPALQENSLPSEPPGKPSHPMGGHRAPASCVMQQFPTSYRFYPPQGVYFNTLSQFVPSPLAPAGSVTCSLCLSLCSCPGSRTPIHWTTPRWGGPETGPLRRSLRQRRSGGGSSSNPASVLLGRGDEDTDVAGRPREDLARRPSASLGERPRRTLATP